MTLENGSGRLEEILTGLINARLIARIDNRYLNLAIDPTRFYRNFDARPYAVEKLANVTWKEIIE